MYTVLPFLCIIICNRTSHHKWYTLFLPLFNILYSNYYNTENKIQYLRMPVVDVEIKFRSLYFTVHSFLSFAK